MSDKNSVTTTVFVPSGPVAATSIYHTALLSVRDAIPATYDLSYEITGTKAKTVDKTKGTEYEVTVSYSPLVSGREEPVDLDRVVKSLEVPAFDTIQGHPEDAA